MSTFSELAVYVTGTEWNWMHGVTANFKLTEVDLKHPKVYEYVWRCASHKDDWEHELLTRGSLATLETRSAREYLMCCIRLHLFSFIAIPKCMGRPLCVVQYYTRLLLDANAGKNNTAYEVLKQAICADRRDVITWLWTEFPVMPAMDITITAVCASVIYEKQARAVKWVCQKYGLAKEHVCDAWSCFVAVITKQFKVLRWLRRGPFKCPWDQPKCLAEAEKRGYDEIANWIRRQRE